MSASLEIVIISMLVSSACSIVGCFLVLRKMAMISDSITHTILLGIVIGFLISGSLSSPLLIIGAAMIGVVTVFITQTLHQTKLLSQDASIGLVFPFLFSIAIILISVFASDIHIDTDSVLLGEIAFAPFDRLIIFSFDIGAKSIYTAAIILIINAVFVYVFYKELTHCAFDEAHSSLVGFKPVLLFYLLMALTSVTAVVSFEAVGSVLVVAFMIIPPSSAYLLTNKLPVMILISIIIACVCSILGFIFAMVIDCSIAGSIAVFAGIIFAFCILLSPNKGIIITLKQNLHNSRNYNQKIVLTVIYQMQISSASALLDNINLTSKSLKKVLKILTKKRLIFMENETFSLTTYGKITAKSTLATM